MNISHPVAAGLHSATAVPQRHATASLEYNAGNVGISRRALLNLGVAAGIAYLAFLLYVTAGLHFSMFRSDVTLYWQDSQHLSQPYSTWWVPGYALLIGLTRAATFHMLSPIAVMCLVSCVFYITAVVTVARLAAQLGLAQPVRLAGIFAVSPFVGLTYSVWPIADVTAIALLMLTLLTYEQRRWGAMVFYAACALMVHKTMWFFVPPLLLVAWVNHRESRKMLPLAFIPLAVWIMAGAIHYGDLLWFVRWGVVHLVKSRGTLPIADGLFGTLLRGSPKDLIKSAIVFAIVGTAIAAAYRCYRRGQWSSVAIAAALLAMAIAFNQYQIWSVGRFSRVLVVPAALAIADTPLWNAIAERAWAYAIVVAACVASNLIFGYYVARVFFG